MIEQQVDSIIRDFGYRLQMQGMSIDSYIKATGIDANSFRAMFHQQAETQVKGRLALQKVAELEKSKSATKIWKRKSLPCRAV